MDVRRLPFDGQLIGPAPDGLAAFRCRVRFPVVLQFLIRQSSDHRTREYLFHEEVLVHDQVPADFRCPEFPEQLVLGWGKPVPVQRPYEGLHKGKPFDIVLMTHGVVKTESRSPIVDHKGQIFEFHLFDEAFHVLDVLKESVLDIRFIGLTHSDQIQGDATAQGAHVGNDVPPQIARGGIAMKKEYRVTGAFVDVVDPRAFNFHIVG